MKIRRKKIETLVDNILTEHQINTPPVPVRKIAGSMGLKISAQIPDEQDVSGVLIRDRANGSAVIGINRRHHSNRQRFTIAHEIGHFLLHGDTDTVHVDRGFLLHKRDGKSSEGTDIHEREANLFAASLLMPRTMLTDDLDGQGPIDIEDAEDVTALAQKYSVSTQAMAIRLSSLGRFSD